MFFDFTLSTFLNIEHQVSSIQYLPGKSNRFKHIDNAS